MSITIAIEAAELIEHFPWLTTEEAQAAVANPDERATVADELADVIIYCFSLPVLDGQSREQRLGFGCELGGIGQAPDQGTSLSGRRVPGTVSPPVPVGVTEAGKENRRLVLQPELR